MLCYDLGDSLTQCVKCLGQNPTVPVWRLRQIGSFKVNIQTVNAPILADKVKVTIEEH